MVIIKCDICGSEIEEQSAVFMRNPESGDGAQYDLCGDCDKKVADILMQMQEEHGIEPEPVPDDGDEGLA